MQKEIRQSWFFQQSPEIDWEYLTVPSLIEQWLGKTDFQPIQGHRFRFISPNGNHANCEVLEVKPYSRLAYSWEKKSGRDNQRYHSKVEWTLRPGETENYRNGTELQLVHNGFIASEDVTGHDNGWNACLRQMKELLPVTAKQING